MNSEPTPITVVTLARTWLGTPYHHQASVKGVGCDCVGLIRGVWREVYGAEPQTLPGYTRDWAETQGHEHLLGAARRHLVEIAPANAQPGDVLIFRWRPNTPAKHCAILATGDRVRGAAGDLPLPARGERDKVRGRNTGFPIDRATMIHALEGAHVSEVSLCPWWRRHLAGVFRFPAFGSLPQHWTARR
ncbi:MAG TPA: NlpC/P60 family protein [Hyphomicrobiaceae bacterium]|nr:NlpC/P60 family protein [Hyphomicrobiaceae bacterium]